jgi:hypothetical protein
MVRGPTGVRAVDPGHAHRLAMGEAIEVIDVSIPCDPVDANPGR